jgi:hypothetical protein
VRWKEEVGKVEGGEEEKEEEEEQEGGRGETTCSDAVIHP